MAKIIRFSPARNESEEWAGHFLEKNLPEHYIVYAGLYISHSQQVFEVDFLVVAEFAMHFVDAKGYTGIVEPGQGTWRVGGVCGEEDSYDKVCMHARRFPHVWRARYPGDWVPWFEGSIFVTGERGQNVEVRNTSDAIKVFDPNNICAHLTFAAKPDERNRVTPVVQSKLQQILALTIRVNERNRHLGDYKFVGSRRPISVGRYRQDAEYQLASIVQRYSIEIADLNAFEKSAEREAVQHEMREKFKLLECLQRIDGVPRCLNPVFERSQAIYALPIQQGVGRKLSEWLLTDNPDLSQRLQVFKRLARIIAEAHGYGISHGGLSASIVLVADGGVSLPGFGDAADATAVRDTQALVRIGVDLFSEGDSGAEAYSADCLKTRKWIKGFLPDNQPILDWFVKGITSPDSIEVKSLLSGEEEQLVEAGEPVEGMVVNGHYRLQSLLGEGSSARAWRAEHVLSGSPCVVKIMSLSRDALELAKREFIVLSGLLHANIVRTFAFERVKGSDLYCLINELGDNTLSDCIAKGPLKSAAESLAWFECCLNALECLKKSSVIHKDIKPMNITISGSVAKLIDFNVSSLDSYDLGTPSYRDPRIGEVEWSPATDLYSLCVCFYELWSGKRAFEGCDAALREFEHFTLDGLPPAVLSAVIAILRGDMVPPGVTYQEFFALRRFIFSLDTPLPPKLIEHWGLTHPDQHFLLSMLIQKGGRMPRRQLVDSTLKLRGQSCSERNRSNQMARLSPLRDALTLIEYPRNRQPEGAHVYVNLTDRAMTACKDFGLL